jgi:hypothetical protein
MRLLKSRLFIFILAITSPYVMSCASSTKWQKTDPMQTVQVPLVWENLPSVKCPEDQRGDTPIPIGFKFNFMIGATPKPK